MKKALLSLLLTIAIMPMAIGQIPAAATFHTTDTTACGSFKWTNDSIYTASTVDTYTSGDTVYVLNLVLEAPKVDTAVAIEVNGGCFARYNEKEWHTAGLFLDTIRVPGQCDSVVKLDIVLSGADVIAEEQATECEYYVASWGDTIRTSVSAIDTTITLPTCNVLVNTLNITIIPVVISSTEQIVVDGCTYDWNGNVISEANVVFFDTVTLANGCDSISSLEVMSFTNRVYDTTDLVVCDSYDYNGTTITRDTAILTVDSTTTCHSYSLLRVTVRNSFNDTLNAPVRDTIGGCSLVWFGNTYTQSDLNDTIYAMGTTTMGGCDSLMAIRITAFNGENHDTVTMERCGYYRWNGDTIRNTGEYTRVETVGECTTTHHLFFTRLANHTEVTREACESYDFVFDSRQGIPNGKDTASFTASGVYVTDVNGDTLFSKHFSTECITYHTLNLSIIPVEQRGTYTVDTTFCDEFVFRFDGENVFNRSIDTTFLITRRTTRNCYDSTGHLILQIKNRTFADIDTVACDSYTWAGFTNTTYTSSTVAEFKFDSIKNSVGCDSLGRLNLTINRTPSVVIEGSWNLQPNASGEGTATLQAVCDDPTVSYAWFIGTEATPASTSDSFEHTVNTNTDIRLETSSVEGCVAKNWITITLNVGIDETEGVQVNVYPNPASRFLNIESTDGLCDIVIYNALGQQVLNQKASASLVTLDLGFLASGNYTMRITSLNGEQATRKFIVNK